MLIDKIMMYSMSFVASGFILFLLNELGFEFIIKINNIGIILEIFGFIVLMINSDKRIFTTEKYYAQRENITKWRILDNRFIALIVETILRRNEYHYIKATTPYKLNPRIFLTNMDAEMFRHIIDEAAGRPAYKIKKTPYNGIIIQAWKWTIIFFLGMLSIIFGLILQFL